MKKIKQIFSITMAVVLTCSMFSACGKKEEKKPVYKLTAVGESSLKSERMYVKEGKSFYICPKGTANYKTTKNAADNSEQNNLLDFNTAKTLMFGDDDVCIPTLYKDQELVFVASDIPETFNWQRFEDEGYSIGVCELSASETNKFQFVVKTTNLLEGSSMRNALHDQHMQSGDSLIINKINSTAVTDANVSIAGSITGLTEDEKYSVDCYKGSNYISLTNITADTHMFGLLETYTSKDYDYTDGDYVVLKIPDNFMSGYYAIEGIGLFRYVDNEKKDGCSDVDFNIPYYYTNEEGTTYTYDEVQESKNSNNVSVNNEDKDVFINTTYIDCSNKSIAVKIKMNEKNEDVENQSVNSLSATLYSPTGVAYQFKPTEEPDVIQCIVENPSIGEWISKVSNPDNIKFNIYTEFTSGHSDTLIHTGSGVQEMTYNLDKDMKKGLFILSWQNQDHAAKITIKAPDDTEYSKEISPDIVYAEGYGYIELLLGNVKYGEYIITVEGDDLGRVRCQTEEMNGKKKPSIKIEKETQQ